MTKAIAFARAHWRALCVALGLALAFGAGRWSKRPPAPTVALKQDAAVHAASATKVDQHKAQAPETITKYKFAPGQGAFVSCSSGVTGSGVTPGDLPFRGQLAEVDVDQRGPVVTDTHEIASSSESVQTHLDLKLTPAALPRYSVSVGLEDPLGAQRPHFEVGARVLTVPLLDVPLWLRLGSTPSRGVVHGATISAGVEF